MKPHNTSSRGLGRGLALAPARPKMACLFDGNDNTPTRTDPVLALLSCSCYPAVLQGVWRVCSSSFNPCGVEPHLAVTHVRKLRYAKCGSKTMNGPPKRRSSIKDK